VAIRFVEEIETVAGCPVSLIATRFAERSLIDRRDWCGHLLNRRDITARPT
jgi:adenylosuccinate synthase